MELTAQVNRHSHIQYWVKLWNGGLLLTEKEQVLLGEILYRYMELEENGVKEPYIGQLVFNTKTMTEIRDKLELSKQGFNNYKMSLRDKGVIFKDEEGVYHVQPQLIPKKSVTFKFDYNG